MPELEQQKPSPEESQAAPRRPYNPFSPLLNPKVTGGILVGSLTLSAALTYAEVKFGPELEKVRASLREKIGIGPASAVTNPAPNFAPPSPNLSTLPGNASTNSVLPNVK